MFFTEEQDYTTCTENKLEKKIEIQFKRLKNKNGHITEVNTLRKTNRFLAGT